MEIEQKLKVALDESRLLILGAQVLFGFQFDGTFQDQFKDLASGSRTIHGAGALLLLTSVGLLIAPSMTHQIAYAGESRKDAFETATGFAGASLLPITLGLGASTYVVFDHLFGRTAGSLLAVALTLTGLSLLYGLGLLVKVLQKRETAMSKSERATPLKVKIEQMLTEARVLIPGAQALLGFQLVATLTKSFQELPASMQYLHAGGLCAVALAAMLLMTPAAVHRIAYDGDDNATFFRIGSLLVVIAALPLALGIASDIAVVFYKITDSMGSALATGGGALVFLLGAWFLYPAWRRHTAGAHPATDSGPGLGAEQR